MSSVLNEALDGSLQGKALTGMITCLSQHPRNGGETALSVQYSADMAKLLNEPAPQPLRPFQKLLDRSRREYAKSTAIVKRGVAGKYQHKREAELSGWKTKVDILEELSEGCGETAGGAKSGGL